MTIEANGTSSTSSSSPSSYSISESYSTIYVSSTTYKVSVTLAEGSTNLVETVWILKDGVAVAVNVAGQNYTGSTAQEFIIGVFAGFTLQVQADSQIGSYTASNYFHATGTSTVSIGPTKVSVTTYAANSLPETMVGCGETTTLTAYSFSVGTPQGASSPLVTYENFAGSEVSNGVTTNFNYILQVTSITIA